jgi:hypothetical protein
MECEEPGCRGKVTRDWGGRKVCEDCFERYRDAWNELRRPADDW